VILNIINRSLDISATVKEGYKIKIMPGIFPELD
jgi:hypothetical protein